MRETTKHYALQIQEIIQKSTIQKVPKTKNTTKCKNVPKLQKTRENTTRYNKYYNDYFGTIFAYFQFADSKCIVIFKYCDSILQFIAILSYTVDITFCCLYLCGTIFHFIFSMLQLYVCDSGVFFPYYVC